MEQLYNSNLISRKWYFCLLLVSIFSGVTPSPTPEANLLCISECGTCPLICSPPPPPVVSKPPPLPIESKPPPSTSTNDSEPPPYLTPIYHATPPPSQATPSPTPPSPATPSSTPPSTPSSTPRTKLCPPPSYITMGTNAPPPPTPPPPKLVVVPSTEIPATGQRNNSYPYYYFYTSKGVAFSLNFSGFFIVFVSFHVIFLVLG